MLRDLRVFSKAEASFFYVFYLSFGGKGAVLIGLQNLSSPTPPPNQGLNLDPWQWKHRVLTAGQQGNLLFLRFEIDLPCPHRSFPFLGKNPSVKTMSRGIPHCQHSSVSVSVPWTGGT